MFEMFGCSKYEIHNAFLYHIHFYLMFMYFLYNIFRIYVFLYISIGFCLIGGIAILPAMVSLIDPQFIRK